MTFLPDVNVWVAIAVAEHEHHDRAANWLESTHGHGLAFCRVTQMGFLRLLTNVHVMKGDQFSLNGAWQLFDRLVEEAGARIVPEPELLEPIWRRATAMAVGGQNAWTNAYICAFAEASGFTVVTFDRGLAGHRKANVRLLDRG
jgi:toxin-antitoxin system PIN domain toxin